VPDLKWFQIGRAGHEPWKEEQGREEFWIVVKNEIEW
jgi:hypothetical protein